MSTRYRSAAGASAPRDEYTQWRPNDSDSERYRAVASTHRTNGDESGGREHRRKHHSSRRHETVDPSDPSASSRPAKHSSRDKVSAAPQASYYPSHYASAPSQYRSAEAYAEPHGHSSSKKKRSPRPSDETALPRDEAKRSRSHRVPDASLASAAAPVQVPSSSQSYYLPPTHTTATHDPTSSSRHHRERDKDREKSSKRDPTVPREKETTRDRTRDTETRRQEKERSKDKERHKEKDKNRERERERESRRAAEYRPSENVHHATATLRPQQATAPAPIVPSQSFAIQHATHAAQPPVVPWVGLTTAQQPHTYAAAPARAASVHRRDDMQSITNVPPASVAERPRTSSKLHRSDRQRAVDKQAGQDSGLSSSEQEQPGVERAKRGDRPRSSKDRGTTGQSSGQSGSDTDKRSGVLRFLSHRRKTPKTQAEGTIRSKHKHTVSDSSALPGAPGQSAGQPTSSQEIAQAWYQRSEQTKPPSQPVQSSSIPAKESPSSRPLYPSQLPNTGAPAGQPSGKHNIPVGVSSSQRARVVSIRAGQGPADPQFPYNPHHVSTRQAQEEPIPIPPPRSYSQDTIMRGGAVPQPQHSPSAHGHAVTQTPQHDPRFTHAQATSSSAPTSHGHQKPGVPDMILRPPSAAPQHPHSGQPSGPIDPRNGHLQVPGTNHRGRATPAPVATDTAPQGHSPGRRTVEVNRSPAGSGAQMRLDTSSATAATYQPSVAEFQRTRSPAPAGTAGYMQGQDASPRFPIHEDAVAAHTQGYQRHAAGTSGYPHAVPHTATGTHSHNLADDTAARTPPKRGLTYPGAMASAPAPSTQTNAYPDNGTYDPRSPKPASLATITADGHASRAYGAHSRDASGQSLAPSMTQGHSPGRYGQPDLGRGGPSSSTPKHSPSGRLHSSHRKGSSDTITQSIANKPSPSGTIQHQLPHRPSATNLPPNGSSRPETTQYVRHRLHSTPSGYPEPTRYRSPPPTGYQTATPNAAPNVATSASVPTHQSTQQPTSSRPPPAPSVYDYQYARSGVPSQPGTEHSQYYVSEDARRAPDRRAATSPAPTVRPPRLTSVSSPNKVPMPLSSAPPQASRQHTYSNTAHTPDAGPYPVAHTRTISDPQYSSRAPQGAYSSATVPSRAASKGGADNYEEILLTPSSLGTPSALPPTTQYDSRNASAREREREREREKEKEKKGGFFGLFRSRSSPPKERPIVPPVLPSTRPTEKRRRNVSITSMQAPNPAPAPRSPASNPAPVPRSPARQAPVAIAAEVTFQATVPTQPSPRAAAHRASTAPNLPIVAPTPAPPSSKMFTPFRLLSRRNRTVSAASVEAVDGTVLNAMFTGADSTRSSTAGRPSPPLRDPMTAAHEWRIKEDEGRGTRRRRPPGVTFDVSDDVPEDGPGPIQKTLRAALAARQATTA